MRYESVNDLPTCVAPQFELQVVKASQAGQCSLCRVVLPDGATSVVGVEQPLTIKRMVDRLLQRRNLLCTTYDVLVRDCSGNQVSFLHFFIRLCDAKEGSLFIILCICMYVCVLDQTSGPILTILTSIDLSQSYECI